jgi:hypothetical protein
VCYQIKMELFCINITIRQKAAVTVNPFFITLCSIKKTWISTFL